MSDNVTALAKLEKAHALLAQVKEAPDAKVIADMAAAAKEYARKQKLGKESVMYAHAVELDAKAKMAECLAGKLSKGTRGQGRPSLGGHKVEPPKLDAPTLADLGISKQESAEGKFLLEIKQAKPQVYKALLDMKTTVSKVKREQKETTREKKRQANREKVVAVASVEQVPVEARFATIVIDPPWDWGDEGDQDQLGRARPDYATMPFADLKDETKLPVRRYADDDCHIYLWITNRSLPKGFDLLEAWGFRYVTCLTWCKPHFGMGNYFRGQTEQILFGVKGSQPLKRKDVGTCFTAPRGTRHSSKPDAFYELVESCSPGPYLEMFARVKRGQDWCCWGADANAS